MPPRKKNAQIEEEWTASRFALPTYVIDQGPPYRPDAVVWMAGDLIIHTALHHPSDPQGVVAADLRAAMAQPMIGAPRRPARVRVADEALVPPIRSVLGEDVAIHVAPVPEAEKVRDLLSQMPPSQGDDGEEDMGPYLPGLPNGAMAQFHEAAARLYRTQPWEVVPSDSHVIGLRAPGVEDGVVSVIGQAGESYGALLFHSMDSFLAFRQMGMEHEGQPPPDLRVNLGASLLSMNFERAAVMPAGLRRAVKQHRWELAGPAAYPLLLAMDADLVPRPVDLADIQLATQLCEALARFVGDHREALAAWPKEGAPPIEMRYQLAERPGAPELTLRAPHPREAELGLDEDDVDHLLDHLREDLIGEGRDPAWVEDAWFLCQELCRFQLDQLDRDLTEFTAGDVEEFLLRHFPERVSATKTQVDRTPEVMDFFFGWLGDHNMLPKKRVLALKKHVAKHRAAFLLAAANPRNFGVAKALVHAMMEKGVDLGNQAEIDRFVAQLDKDGGVDSLPSGKKAKP